MVRGGRTLVTFGIGVLAASMVAGLPVAQGQDQKPTNDRPVSTGPGTDADEPPLEVRLAQRSLLGPRNGGPRIIDVHFFRNRTQWGESPLTESYARELIRQTDEWAIANSAGKIRLRFASLTDAPPIEGDPCLAIDPVWKAVRPLVPVKPLPGGTEATWVSVTAIGEDCPYGGRGYVGLPGMWMHLYEPSVVHPRDLGIFVHELGHNLGLRHSNGYAINQSWPPDSSTMLEYGDHADVMGWGSVWQSGGRSRPSDLHAHNRNLLGVLPDTSIAFTRGGTEEFDVAPVGAESGVTALYLPWLDRSKFVIDYRPASYGGGILDFGLGSGSGVYVRLVDSGANEGPEPYTALSGTGAFTTRVGQYEWQLIHGYRIGERLTLPSGAVVEVLSLGDSSARVRVTSPPDVTAPSVDGKVLRLRGCVDDPCTLRAATARWGARGAEYEVKAVDLPDVSDDVWVSTAQVTLGDEVIARVDRTPNGRNAETRRSLPGSVSTSVLPGTHTIRLVATDLAGNEGVASATVMAPQVPPPTAKWSPFNRQVRYSFPGWSRIVPCGDKTACIGITIEALKPCKRGVNVVIDVQGPGKRILATMRNSSPPLAKGERAFVYFETPAQGRIDWYVYRSMTCS